MRSGLQPWEIPVSQTSHAQAQGKLIQSRHATVLGFAAPSLQIAGQLVARAVGAQPQLAQLKALAADGLLTLSPDRIEITGQGRLLLRNICMVFDEYLQNDRQPRFSRTL